MSTKAKGAEGKKDPKDVVVATAGVPVDRAALLAEIEAAKTVKELATAVGKVLALVK